MPDLVGAYKKYDLQIISWYRMIIMVFTRVYRFLECCMYKCINAIATTSVTWVRKRCTETTIRLFECKFALPRVFVVSSFLSHIFCSFHHVPFGNVNLQLQLRLSLYWQIFTPGMTSPCRNNRILDSERFCTAALRQPQSIYPMYLTWMMNAFVLVAHPRTRL